MPLHNIGKSMSMSWLASTHQVSIPDNVLFVPEMEEVDEEDNKVVNLPEHLLSFIHESPSIVIKPFMVADIVVDPEAIQENLKALEAQMKALEANKDKIFESFQQTQKWIDQRSATIAHTSAPSDRDHSQRMGPRSNQPKVNLRDGRRARQHVQESGMRSRVQQDERRSWMRENCTIS